MSIVRVHKSRGDFAVLPSAMLNNRELTWAARGMLAYLLDKPDNWQIMMNDLIRQSPAGRQQTRRYLKELEAAGYIRRDRINQGNGLFLWVSEVFEIPQLDVVGGQAVDHNLAAQPSSRNRPMVDSKPSVGKPSMVEPSMVEPSMVSWTIQPAPTEPETNQTRNQGNHHQHQAVNGAGGDALSPEQKLAFELLSVAAPGFHNPIGFVKSTDPKLVASWAHYVHHDPGAETIENPAGFIRHSVKGGSWAPRAGAFDAWWYARLEAIYLDAGVIVEELEY